jgi:nucleoside-diphosphate-sugar epimerase
MRYLLTGATGFIGEHVVRQLLAAGHDLVALVRSPDRAASLAELGVELAPGDITEPATLPGPMRGVDGVFHLAGWYKVGARHRDLARRINVDGTRNVLATARDLGVPRTVYTSTLAVYGHTGEPVDESYRMDGPWLSLYDRTKWLAQYEVAVPLMEAGVPIVIVLPGLVHGRGDHSNIGQAFRDYLRGRLPVVPSQGGCWCHVEDTARGIILAMEQGRAGEAYNLAGHCRYWEDILPIAEEITGIKPPSFVLRPWLARVASALMRPVNAVVPLPPNYHPETLRVAAGTAYFGSDAKARRELGWEPRPLREGLERTLRGEMEALGIPRQDDSHDASP